MIFLHDIDDIEEVLEVNQKTLLEAKTTLDQKMETHKAVVDALTLQVEALEEERRGERSEAVREREDLKKSVKLLSDKVVEYKGGLHLAGSAFFFLPWRLLL